ncbi:response regulator, partial [Cetobacterium sp.]
MKKVLVVEDDPMVAMINMEYISKISDLEIVGLAVNKEEVFKYLKTEKVDLILMDIFLGGENGLDILK